MQVGALLYFIALAHQYLVELQHVQIGVPDKADISATVAHHDWTFADPDIFTSQPRHQFVHTVDNKGGVRVAGPFDRRAKEHIAFTGRLAVVNQVNSQTSRVHEATSLDLWCKLVGVADKT